MKNYVNVNNNGGIVEVNHVKFCTLWLFRCMRPTQHKLLLASYARHENVSFDSLNFLNKCYQSPYSKML